VDKEVYTIREAAKLIGYSDRHLRQRCIDGNVPGAYKITEGRKWLIPRAAVQQFSQGQLRQPIVQPISSQTQQLQDPRITEARRKHDEDLYNFAARCKGMLIQDPDKGLWSPVLCSFDSKDAAPRRTSYVRNDFFWNVKDDLTVTVGFDWEYEPLFDCLRSHLSDNEILWDSFEELKQLASEQIAKVAKRSSEFPDKSLAISSSRRLEELVEIICRELEFAILGRVFPGQCRVCQAILAGQT